MYDSPEKRKDFKKLDQDLKYYDIFKKFVNDYNYKWPLPPGYLYPNLS